MPALIVTDAAGRRYRCRKPGMTCAVVSHYPGHPASERGPACPPNTRAQWFARRDLAERRARKLRKYGIPADVLPTATAEP